MNDALAVTRFEIEAPDRYGLSRASGELIAAWYWRDGDDDAKRICAICQQMDALERDGLLLVCGRVYAPRAESREMLCVWFCWTAVGQAVLTVDAYIERGVR